MSLIVPVPSSARAARSAGDEVEFELRDDEIVLFARPRAAGPGGRFAHSGMAARLLDERAREPR